jgi:hypothetical protein
MPKGSPTRRCICGRGKRRGLHKHHVIYQQELRRIVARDHRAADLAGPPDIVRERTLIVDPRNIVLMGYACHAGHHNRSRVLPLAVLPDSCFEFAAEVLGPGPAYEYLRRRYASQDARLEALLAKA